MNVNSTHTTFRQKLLLAVAAAALAATTSCSADTPEPAESAVESDAGIATDAASDTASGSPETTEDAKGSLSTKEACTGFNTLFAEYAANKGTDANAYEDVYLKADELGDQVTGDLKGLFASLSVLALEHATATETGGSPSQEARDAVSDQFMASAPTCTAEGVTLRL